METSLHRDAGFWVMIAIGLALLVAGPLVWDLFQIMQITQYVVLSVYVLSLSYIWGFGGILSFGQAAFFGLGAYTFSVASINMGETTFPFLLAFGLPALFGAALGYFMFYGKLSDVYMGVVTMVVTLIFWKLINHTAGPEYAIGDARLGGFNGIPSVPVLNVPGKPEAWLDPGQMFQVFMAILVILYIVLRTLIASDFGRVSLGIRENETRAALLGYDVRRHKVIVFAIGAGIAGMAGGMWATYQTFVDPNVFSLEMSAKALIWTMAGGVGTLAGPIIAVVVLQYLSLKLGEMHVLNNNFILGGIMMVLVLLVPKGGLPTLRDALVALKARTPAALQR
ncbi:urea ABC transporter [Pseudooceanicola sp. CBS1P-1]|uniref:Urea ABC transporter n=1 Tax=Pseudooceanicola albus TaxID=2692189 RepID=A0A6L7G807_9RHOB|nr:MULTISPECIES: urea ABC transporter [Pseudooceanicola]MBT9386112.1 urea ABC transporter [Pseudooceanicola endophyticus]MXN19470.1 urea ABC transporter [Pseudooceanicola albus]